MFVREVTAAIVGSGNIGTDRSAIVQSYAGVYGSFLLHAERAAQRYGVPAHEILQKVGEAGYVGGQEDMIIDIALQLVAERDRAA
jgi:4-hydroxy 2-oxovalerate aldolase